MLTLHRIGKDKIINHQEVPYKVLNHEYSFSERGKTNTLIDTSNLIIKGDNLNIAYLLFQENKFEDSKKYVWEAIKNKDFYLVEWRLDFSKEKEYEIVKLMIKES